MPDSETTGTTGAKLRSGIPVLASLDLTATVAFYEEKLGFASVAAHDDYAIARRDDVELHFWVCDDRKIPEQTSCRVRVDGIDELYEEYRSAGVVHPNGSLQRKPWGLQFAALDGDGNLLVFIEARQSGG
jgi:catechol 2,3-dioxygenase-like lactoylglutathione lyase family enzyme